MALNDTIALLGRRLRAAVVGGGTGALIGSAHRTAMQFDNRYDIVAGVLSSRPDQALAQGKELGLARPYASFDDLIRGESARDDRVDVIVIMTPNDTHFDYCRKAVENGFHVICDKPVANTLQEARELVALAQKCHRRLFVTYNYTGYPMVRQARAMVESGLIGTPHLVEVHYAQGNLGTLIEQGSAGLDKQLAWRLDPSKGGSDHLLLDVGVHAQNLMSFVTKRAFTRVFADIGPALKGRRFDDSAVILARLEGEVMSSLSITKAANGAPQVFGINVYGEKGGLNWEQTAPNELRFVQQGRPIQIFTRAVGDLAPLVKRSLRPLHAHPEGVREAFANIYGDFADCISADIAGTAPDPHALIAPTIVDGAASLAFVDACARSKASGSWTDLDPDFQSNPT